MLYGMGPGRRAGPMFLAGAFALAGVSACDEEDGKAAQSTSTTSVSVEADPDGAVATATTTPLSASAATSTTGAPRPSQAANYVGRQYRTMAPNIVEVDGRPATGLKFLGGISMDGTYGTEELQSRDGRMIWFYRLMEPPPPAGSPPPRKVVVDGFDVPLEQPGTYLSRAGLCRLNEVRDPEIVAFLNAGKENVQWWTDIRIAWRLNRATERIEPIPAAGVSCRNEGYGV